MDITTYILSKRYVEDSLAGAGALKGKSAYEIAKDNGFVGTEKEWLLSLQGSTPSIGENGNWFIDTFDTGIIASPSLAGYATESYVRAQIALIDLEPYVIREELNAAIAAIPKVDLTLYATKEEVEAAIAAIQFPAVDLSNYVQKTDLPSGVLATQDYVVQKIAEAQFKVIELPPATASQLGLVKIDDDTITIDENDVIRVNRIDFKQIYLDEHDELILDGGKAK